jgi:hypothetical protein
MQAVLETAGRTVGEGLVGCGSQLARVAHQGRHNLVLLSGELAQLRRVQLGPRR